MNVREDFLMEFVSSRPYPPLPGIPDRRPPQTGCPLSEREQDILLMISLGLSNKYIARRMDISVRTVEVHRASLRCKLGTGTVNRLEAMLTVLLRSSSQRLSELLEIDVETVESQRVALRQLIN